jgi:hypothetical protein
MFSQRKRRIAVTLLPVIVLAAALLIPVLPAASQAPAGALRLNEFVFNHTGTDNYEFVEVFGAPAVDYATYFILELEGDNGSAIGAVDGVIQVGVTDAAGFWTTGYRANEFENGTVTLMLVEGFSGALNDDLDTDNNGVFDVTPWTAIVDDVGVNDGGAGDVTYSATVLAANYDGQAFAPGGASRIPDGADTDTVADWVRNDFDGEGLPSLVGTPVIGEALNTSGAANALVRPMPPIINEFVFNHTGTDTNEFVEVFGDVNTDYSDYWLLEIEGDSGSTPGVIKGVYQVGATDAAGFWTTGYLNNEFENGTLTALLVETFTGALNDDLDTDNNGVFDVTPWTTIADDVAVNDGGAGDIVYAASVLAPNYDGQAFTPGGASRIPNAADTDAAVDWMRNDFDGAGLSGFTGTPVFGEAFNTSGALNAAVPQPAEVCGDPATAIHVVQGSGLTSPEAGNTHSVEGVVVGDFQTEATIRGFFLQEDDGDVDADPLTSEGLFIYDNYFNAGGVDVNVGDFVRVRGAIQEYFGLTEMDSLTQVLICPDPPVATPAALTLPLASSTDLERFEGMAVLLPQTLYVTENYNLGRYGEVLLSSGGRLLQPTNVATPGAAANALQAANDLNQVILDDGSTQQNPDPIDHPAPGLTAANTLRGADTVTGLAGVVTYTWSGSSGTDNYRIHPTGTVTFTPTNPRPAAPVSVGGSLRVASFNVLNYFNGDGQGGGFPTARGANTALEFQRQRDKIIAAILGMDADVVGLMEIENDGYGAVSAIQDLVNGLNAAAPAGVSYAIIDPGLPQIGNDEITVGLIYRVETVMPFGPAVTTNAYPFDALNRQPLAQTFAEIATGGRVTVAVNHFKSKGSCPGDGSVNDDQGDGQGCWNAVRLEAANALAAWLAADPTGMGDSDSLIIGDLNSYAMEEPITALQGLGYTNLIEAFAGAAAYSYVFEGQAGYLDHALSNAALTPQVTGATVWHINADEPRVLDYNEEFKTAGQVTSLYSANAYRASDHDPAIVGLNLDPSVADLAITKTASSALATPGSVLTYTLTISNTGPDLAAHVMVTDLLPAETVLAAAMPPSPACTQSSGLVTCTLGNLAAGEVATVTISVLVDCCQCPLTLINTAGVTSDTADGNTGNNTATLATPLDCTPTAVELSALSANPAAPVASLPWQAVAAAVGLSMALAARRRR